jgi:hypothetical protein
MARGTNSQPATRRRPKTAARPIIIELPDRGDTKPVTEETVRQLEESGAYGEVIELAKKLVKAS